MEKNFYDHIQWLWSKQGVKGSEQGVKGVNRKRRGVKGVNRGRRGAKGANTFLY